MSGPEAPAPATGPTFDEPWQAQLLALADTLARSGLFTPAAWSDALGAALRRSAADGAPDTAGTYYQSVLEALEGLLTTSGALTPDDLAARREAWERAYAATPHGQPVELSRAGTSGPG